MTIGFDRPAPPASPEAIRGVESRLGVALPDDCKAFRQQNGRKPEQNFLEGGDDIGVSAVRYFYSAGSNEDEYVDDHESIASLYRGPEHQLNLGFLPIGEDDFGNLTCLKVGGEDYGAVYIWDHEEVGARRMRG